MLRSSRYLLCLSLLAMLVVSCSDDPAPLPTTPVVQMPSPARGQLQPDPDHPMYWRFQGRTVMLLGGSIEDNLFQIDNLTEHLDSLSTFGGNYVRNTLSSRDAGNVQPHYIDEIAGKYDLERWSGEYWQRFDRFLRATAARGIVVQFELWDRFDFARKPWINNSFNPVNNSNYSTEDTGLEHRYDDHPGKLDMPFFRTVPLLDNNLALLRHQQRYIDRVLESSLGHDHVLYAMDNETHVRPEWGEYWATYIQRKAAAAGRRVYCTEMWDPPSLADKMHKHTTSRPDLYAFIDISQNNHMDGELHYSRLVTFREAIVASGVPRPLNNVKVYGADGGNFDDTREGIRRFWQNILGGAASTRFHRPPAGLGLSGIARSQLPCRPDVRGGLRSLRHRANPGRVHAGPRRRRSVLPAQARRGVCPLLPRWRRDHAQSSWEQRVVRAVARYRNSHMAGFRHPPVDRRRN